MLKKVLRNIGLAVALGVGAAAVPAQAAPIGLSLLIDGSGSISAADYAVQKNGYINALTSILATDGSVVLEIIQFSTSVSTVFSLQLIDTAAKKAAVIAALTAMTQPAQNTATGPAIQQAQADLLAYFGAGMPGKQIIDVSTDGFGNVGINENTASLAAVAAGVEQVNVLCIGGGANCNFNHGAGSFNVAATFANFQATLEAKLRRELPEPGPLALLAIGLLAMVLTRRRA